MRKFFLIGLIFFLITIPISTAVASSKQAYGDYLYQFDRYRQTYSDFQVARDSYLKYHSLTSQTQAVNATQTMLTQRNLLLRSYLLFLNEKLNEDWGLTATARQQYQGNLQKEIAFLDAQNREIVGLTTLDDAVRMSKLLETHAIPLQITIRQTIIGITLGKLSALSRTFDQSLQMTQTLVNANAALLTPEKISTINQWLIQIQNTRNLYQQKIEEITDAAGTQFSAATTVFDIDQKFTDINKKFTEAQHLLAQTAAYLGELVTALQYQ